MKIRSDSAAGYAMLTLIAIISGFSVSMAQTRVLVYTKTAGYHHVSIAVGKDAIIKLGKTNGFAVDTTSDSTRIVESNLKKYAAVIFLSTTGNMLSPYEEVDFERYIQAGGGFVGIHAAADAGYDWKWYGRLVGAYFDSHPQQQQATINVVDRSDASTQMLPANWIRKDEWYNYKSIMPDIHVLLNLDEKTYTGGKNGANHPIAWYHDFDGGKAWYTGLGHTDGSYSEDLFLKHILGGIKYAIGKGKLDYTKAKSQHAPESNRFTKTQLSVGRFYEPTEMTILPNLDILIAQRHGEILLYKNSTHKLQRAAMLKVYDKANVKGVNAEEGVLGIQKDPDFATNHFIYVYYSPVDTSVNRLSRFKFENDVINLKSEKIVLQVYSQRQICCHTGGSIAFGKDHTLYLSTGDNSTPFDEPNPKKGKPNINSFAPLDDRPGFKQWDSRRSAGNSNDLRGKILRINIQPDGSYTIPEGNLFAPGQANTRPEIFVMGDRNPYRISVDKKRGFLYWGEIGPDANDDSLATRGPRGYDEFNQARKAGFFGWPLFIGPNIPYHEYDFNTGKTGIRFDPEHPLNNSANNTGLKELPPAQPAFIWYPYGASSEFPQVGSSGRSAMAGPIYYADEFKKPAMPAYYNGKVFFYDWMRGFIKAISLQPNGDYDKMEPFMDDTKFNAPIDMEMGPDGKIYVLEYGNGWFTQNKDSGLSRLDYNSGNRAPQITGITANKATGTLPFTLTLTAKATDPEKDAIAAYTWNLGDGVRKVTTQPRLTYTYTKKGNYTITVSAKDNKGATGKISDKSVSIYAGNDAGVIAAQQAAIKNAAQPGKALMMTLDCKTCHKEAEKSIGPAFVEVAKKYAHDDTNQERLIRKVIGGGSGTWGDVAMPAHPTLKPEQVKLIVNWVFTLAPTSK